jgi:hypothetical protein
LSFLRSPTLSAISDDVDSLDRALRSDLQRTERSNRALRRATMAAIPPDAPNPPNPPIPAPANLANPTPQDVAAALIAIATALTAFTNSNAAMAAALAGGGVPAAGAAAPMAPATLHLDPIFLPLPFDLSSRSGSSVYARASKKLDFVWDGSVAKFPDFMVSLKLRSDEANWGAAAPHSILLITSTTNPTLVHNLLQDYQRITDLDIAGAAVNQTDDRARQNATALYRALKQSLEGDIKSTLFQQLGNLPASEDGVALFFRLTQLTVTSSLQLAMISLTSILQFSPADYNFNIASINKALNHLFVLANTRERSLSQGECIQHTLTAYSRILQPDEWAR